MCVWGGAGGGGGSDLFEAGELHFIAQSLRMFFEDVSLIL